MNTPCSDVFHSGLKFYVQYNLLLLFKTNFNLIRGNQAPFFKTNDTNKAGSPAMLDTVKVHLLWVSVVTLETYAILTEDNFLQFLISECNSYCSHSDNVNQSPRRNA